MRRVLALLAAVAFVLVLVRPSGASSDANNYHWTEVGDSKTAGGCWQSQLNTKLVTRFGAATETPTRLATGGWSVSDARNNIDSWLAGTSTVPDVVLFNFGVNDSHQGLSQSTFETNSGYILDQTHAKWPSATLLVARAWASTCTGCSTPIDDTWIPNVLSTRSSFAKNGFDERIWLENGDNGASMTTDGIHYSTAGCTAAATNWDTVIGTLPALPTTTPTPTATPTPTLTPTPTVTPTAPPTTTPLPRSRQRPVFFGAFR